MAASDPEVSALSERIDPLREFCERRGWTLKTWTGTQREPGNGVVIRMPDSPNGVTLRAESHDSLTVALARIENALRALGDARSDVYLHEPPTGMGTI